MKKKIPAAPLIAAQASPVYAAQSGPLISSHAAPLLATRSYAAASRNTINQSVDYRNFQIKCFQFQLSTQATQRQSQDCPTHQPMK